MKTLAKVLTLVMVVGFVFGGTTTTTRRIDPPVPGGM